MNWLNLIEAIDVYRGGWVEPRDLRPSPGDIIDFNRDVYTHHGIYVGDGDVVHKWADGHSPVCMADIIFESVKNVAGPSLVRVNNHEIGALRRSLTARDPDLIVQLAVAEVGNQELYTVFDQNCEEYVTRMRYGTGWSSQAETAARAARGIVQGMAPKPPLASLNAKK